MFSALEAHPWNSDYKLAPPHPYWPEWLPEPYTTEEEGETCFPYPGNLILSMHLSYWDEYPGECQQRIDKGWHAKEELETEYLRGPEPPPVVNQGWKTWEVAIAVGLAVLVTGTVAGGAGYIIGRTQ